MNSLCDVCIGDSTTTMGAYLLDGDATNTLTFLCPHCYQLSSNYRQVLREKYSGYADELVKDIEAYKEGERAIDLFYDLTNNWKDTVAIVTSLLRLYRGYKAGLVKHPLYVESMHTIVTSLVYGVGFPVKEDIMYFPLNMNITTSANNLLFRRNLRKLYRVKMYKEDLQLEEVIGHVCEVCLKEQSSIKCKACECAYYCSLECLFDGASSHRAVCEELRRVNVEVDY